MRTVNPTLRIVRPLWIISILQKDERKSSRKNWKHLPFDFCPGFPFLNFMAFYFSSTSAQPHPENPLPPKALCHFSRCLGVWPRQNNISALGNRRESNKQQSQRHRLHLEKIGILNLKRNQNLGPKPCLSNHLNYFNFTNSIGFFIALETLKGAVFGMIYSNPFI